MVKLSCAESMNEIEQDLWEYIATATVAKCHGYDGYIRVKKMFAGWGEKFGRTCNFLESRLFGKIYATYASFPCQKIAQFDRVVKICPPKTPL